MSGSIVVKYVIYEGFHIQLYFVKYFLAWTHDNSDLSVTYMF